MGIVICLLFNMIKVVAVLCGLSLVQCGVPSCETVYEEKCWDEPRQQCHTVQKPFITTQYEQECHSIQVPKVESVPEQKCREEQECNTRYEQECNPRYEQACHTTT